MKTTLFDWLGLRYITVGKSMLFDSGCCPGFYGPKISYIQSRTPFQCLSGFSCYHQINTISYSYGLSSHFILVAELCTIPSILLQVHPLRLVVLHGDPTSTSNSPKPHWYPLSNHALWLTNITIFFIVRSIHIKSPRGHHGSTRFAALAQSTSPIPGDHSIGLAP